MLIIEIKDSESIDRLVKRYKRKHPRTRLRNELRRRQQFTKPSVQRREEVLQATYRNRKEVQGT